MNEQSHNTQCFELHVAGFSNGWHTPQVWSSSELPDDLQSMSRQEIVTWIQQHGELESFFRFHVLFIDLVYFQKKKYRPDKQILRRWFISKKNIQGFGWCDEIPEHRDIDSRNLILPDIDRIHTLSIAREVSRDMRIFWLKPSSVRYRIAFMLPKGVDVPQENINFLIRQTRSIKEVSLLRLNAVDDLMEDS